MFGVRISPPKQPMSLKPRSSATMTRKLGLFGGAVSAILAGYYQLPAECPRLFDLQEGVCGSSYDRRLSTHGLEGELRMAIDIRVDKKDTPVFPQTAPVRIPKP